MWTDKLKAWHLHRMFTLCNEEPMICRYVNRMFVNGHFIPRSSPWKQATPFWLDHFSDMVVERVSRTDCTKGSLQLLTSQSLCSNGVKELNEVAEGLFISLLYRFTGNNYGYILYAYNKKRMHRVWLFQGFSIFVSSLRHGKDQQRNQDERKEGRENEIKYKKIRKKREYES